MSPAAPRGPGAQRFWFAHALRGVAALMVVWEHLFVGWWQLPVLATMFLHVPEGPPPVPPADLFYLPLVGALGDLRIGISVFFVISGFLIPFSLERRGAGRFLLVRALRLYPVWIAATALSAAALGQGAPFGPVTWAWNALLVNDALGHATANPAAWTLLVTLKFYVVCTLLAPFGGTRRVVPVVTCLTALTAFALATEWLYLDRVLAGQVGVANLVFSLGFAAPFICFIFTGVAIHNAVRGHWSPPTALLVGAIALTAHAVGAFGGILPGAIARPYTLGSCLGLAAFLIAYRLRARIPRTRALDVMGRLSYPLYAIHYVVGGVLSLALFRATGWALVSIVLATLVVLALSWAVNRWVEEPANRYGKRARLPRPPRPGAPLPAPDATPVAADAEAPAAAGGGA